ncbi:3-isopropylmalate dehydratase small subunit [Ponticaulis sp.]|uniref:3-isopropylmalate dehydratase small subunit n=1 Tax=Ponticaulis sp. TaxID=2020902 RepID=UPI000B72D107|nr:3-isopropylmalate dehydratase small subunit [Ponticaulis sp.]MAJ07698.1 3-isopropylmalate dehydratase small subunit [Ponticaulis sp.]RPG17923.1 MAG: 3-isopropylmalate dehydratase small subunit [Hyphomonadaceae bacterium TMED125]HBH88863.1 3-isopropylmalate dehydratase small subunit [Hyphomonadaceae bacterium]HBJ91559.1 3-isopropylmalate dehydratase small subunit [Hyphomonadaceae bacterium]
MEAFKTLTGPAAPLRMSNVDTDMIIPKQFLKTTERTGLSRGLFFELKTNADGSPNPDFVLNRDEYKDASILIAGANFGCGSSREHAPWALLDQGIRCVIAPSFADIFYNNCFKNGILPIALPQSIVEKMMDEANGGNHIFTVDLENMKVTLPDGEVVEFDLDGSRRHNLLEGLDDIGLTLQAEGRISEFETRRKLATPWLERA